MTIITKINHNHNHNHRSLPLTFSHSLPHSLTHSLTHSLPPSLIHLFSHSLTPSLIHHSLTFTRHEYVFEAIEHHISTGPYQLPTSYQQRCLPLPPYPLYFPPPLPSPHPLDPPPVLSIFPLPSPLLSLLSLSCHPSPSILSILPLPLPSTPSIPMSHHLYTYPPYNPPIILPFLFIPLKGESVKDKEQKLSGNFFFIEDD